MVTRAHPRFHLAELLFSCCFIAIFFVRGSQEKNRRSLTPLSPTLCASIPSPLRRLRNTSRTPFQSAGKPDKQVGYHIAAIGFVQHLVPTALIKIVSD